MCQKGILNQKYAAFEHWPLMSITPRATWPPLGTGRNLATPCVTPPTHLYECLRSDCLDCYGKFATYLLPRFHLQSSNVYYVLKTRLGKKLYKIGFNVHFLYQEIFPCPSPWPLWSVPQTLPRFIDYLRENS
jgi:hypothetical protein